MPVNYFIISNKKETGRKSKKKKVKEIRSLIKTSYLMTMT
jgi:hypothetical protein